MITVLTSESEVIEADPTNEQSLSLVDKQTINDIYVDGDGNLAIGEDAYAMAEIVKDITRTQLGELQFDEEAGVPYFETIFSSRTNADLFLANVQRVIQNISGVIRIESFTSSINGDVLNYEAQIRTQYGVISING